MGCSNGALCAKGFPKEYEHIIAAARKIQQKGGESSAPVVEEITVADGPEEPPKPKPVVVREEHKAVAGAGR